MPSYKLSYFDAYGRGELARLIFAAAKQDYEDHRFSFDEWKTIKPTTPFGVCPVLYIDGTPLCESGAIIRHLATDFGMNGANSLQAAYIEMVVGMLGDSYSKLPIFEKDEKVKEEKFREVYKEKICPVLEKFEKKIAEKKTKFLIGDKLSYADLKLMHNLIMTERFDKSYLSKYPNLVAIKERVAATDGVKQYLAKRAVKPF